MPSHPQHSHTANCPACDLMAEIESDLIRAASDIQERHGASVLQIVEAAIEMCVDAAPEDTSDSDVRTALIECIDRAIRRRVPLKYPPEANAPGGNS